MNNNNRTVDWFDVIIGLLYTTGFVGALLIMRLAFGIDIEKLAPSETSKIEAAILGGLVLLMGSLYLKMIYHWMEKAIKWTGDRGVEKASVHGLPVNANNMGFKFSFYTKEIADSTRMIEEEGLYEQFEETVWFVNMENRFKMYKYNLIKKQKKLTKKIRKYKRKKLDSLMKATMDRLDIVKDNLKLTQNMKVAITKWDYDTTKKLDDILIELIDINVNDIEAYDLMNVQNKNPHGFWERFRNNKVILYFDKNILPLIFPVVFIAATIFYAVVWKDQWTQYEQDAFMILMSILGYMLPLRIFQYVRSYFPKEELRPVLVAGEIFSKFRARYHQQSRLFKEQLRKEQEEFNNRIKTLLDDSNKEEDNSI
jgi:hypothetical protein